MPHGTYSLNIEGSHCSPTAKKMMFIAPFLYDAKRKVPVRVEKDLDGLEIHAPPLH